MAAEARFAQPANLCGLQLGSANSTRQPGLSHANGGPDPLIVAISEAKQRELRAIARRLESAQARYVYFFDRLTAGDSPEVADWAWAIPLHCGGDRGKNGHEEQRQCGVDQCGAVGITACFAAGDTDGAPNCRHH